MAERTAIFPLPEGTVVMQFPEPLSSASVDDLEAYLALVLRRLRRNAEAPATEEARHGEE